MVVHEQLSSVLKELRLSSVLESLELRVEQALEQPLSHQEFLVRLLQDELERRQARSLAHRLRAAQFEGEKTLENFDFCFNPELPRAQLLELGCCGFVEHKENVLLLGPAGVGKSHLAQALGHRAARAGYSVRFVGCHPLLEQLHAARADDSLEKRLVELTRVDLLILDDVGVAIPTTALAKLLEPLQHLIVQPHLRSSEIDCSFKAISTYTHPNTLTSAVRESPLFAISPGG